MNRVAVKKIELPPGLVKAAEQLLIGQAPQPIDAPQIVYNIATVAAASNFGGSGVVDAPIASGEHSKVEIHQRIESQAALDLVEALIREIQANAGNSSSAELEDNARIIQGEILAADVEKRQPDRHRIKNALTVITDLASAGGSVVAVASQLARIFGIG